MNEETLGKALFASIAAWFLVIAAQVVFAPPQAAQIASVPEHIQKAVG